MEYPKKVMRRSELLQMGVPETVLDLAFVDRTQTFAWKQNPKARNSPIIFDTAGFEKWRLRQVEISKKSVQGVYA